MDRQILYWVGGWPDGFAPGMKFLSEATNHLWVKLVLAAVVVGMMIAGPRTRRAAIFALLAFLLANELTDLLKDFFPANRPYQDGLTGLRDALVGHSENPGTASAHSANMAAVATAFTYCLGWWGAPWIALAVLTGLSRVYVASHYPWQVLLGWACGFFAAILLIKTWEAYRKLKATREDTADEQA